MTTEIENFDYQALSDRIVDGAVSLEADLELALKVELWSKLGYNTALEWWNTAMPAGSKLAVPLRNQYIAVMAAEGASQREIGAAVGIGQQHVSKILTPKAYPPAQTNEPLSSPEPVASGPAPRKYRGPKKAKKAQEEPAARPESFPW